MDKFDVIQPYLLPIMLIILGVINVTLIALVVALIHRLDKVMEYLYQLWDFSLGLHLIERWLYPITTS